jgi:hypothetical protein
VNSTQSTNPPASAGGFFYGHNFLNALTNLFFPWPTRPRIPRGKALFQLALLGFGLLASSVAMSDQLRTLDPSSLKNILESAVVPIKVPLLRLTEGYQSHHIEDCSGTLLATEPTLILTAWHCFDGGQDLTLPAKAQLSGQWVPLKKVASGGSMAADWALLAVASDKPIQQMKGLGLVSSAPVAGVAETGMTTAVTVAGYRKHANTITAGRTLVIDEYCDVIEASEAWLVTSCDAEAGSSGGPAVALTPQGVVVTGVISAKRDDGRLLVTPVTEAIYPSGVAASPP